jgi:DNA-binding transcriptional MerR regulator
MIKQIMIPMAAFAVTATAASAFNPDMLEQIDVDLTDSQVSALEEAHELKTQGTDRKEVKTFLEENGVDTDTMKEIKEAGREYRDEQREEVQTALDNDDYEAFLAAIADSPLADAIESEADFETFKAAHELKEAGDHEAAKELMTELDIEHPEGHGRKGGHNGEGPRGMKRTSGE